MNKTITKVVALALAVVLTTGAAVEAKVLSVGSRGSDVANLQMFLIDSGYSIPLIESGTAAPGYFGQQTRNAVAVYQEGNEQQPTGSIDSSEFGSAKLGAVPTLDSVDNPYVSIGGVKRYNYFQTITATSSAFCSIRNPYNATSTLESFSVQINSLGGINTGNAFDLSTSTSQYASSTPGYIASYVIPGAGNFFTTVWSGVSGTTTSSRVIGLTPGYSVYGSLTGASDNIIRPTDYLTVRIGSTTPGTFAAGYLGGTCSGVIRKL